RPRGGRRGGRVRDGDGGRLGGGGAGGAARAGGGSWGRSRVAGGELDLDRRRQAVAPDLRGRSDGGGLRERFGLLNQVGCHPCPVGSRLPAGLPLADHPTTSLESQER